MWGAGEGSTPISSFDKALYQAGIHNFNLLKLSSIIPPKSSVNMVQRYGEEYTVGSILKAVISRMTSSNPGETISAGLGWLLTEEGGIFLEHSLIGNKKECENTIRTGISDMAAYRDWPKGEVNCVALEHTVVSNGSLVIIAMYHITPPEVNNDL